jgi:hypothetical protein
MGVHPSLMFSGAHILFLVDIPIFPTEANNSTDFIEFTGVVLVTLISCLSFGKTHCCTGEATGAVSGPRKRSSLKKGKFCVAGVAGATSASVYYMVSDWRLPLFLHPPTFEIGSMSTA